MDTSMNRKIKFRHFLPAFATIAVCAMVPFNMGGCADATAALGGMVGGSQGQSLGHALGGGLEASKLNERDERAMGEAVAMQVTSKFNISADAELNHYAVLVGLTLANASPRPDGNWFFAVVDDPQPNAFSGPDGYVFVTTAALKQMHDESELAGVLAHEMSHVLSHHGLAAAKRSGQAAALAEGASAAAQSANQQLGMFSGAVGAAADVTLVKGYDRGQEDQADAGAVKLLRAAGYDPAGYLNFLTRVSEAQKEAREGAQNVAFSTHPDAASRIAKIRSQIGAGGGGATLADRYAKMTATLK